MFRVELRDRCRHERRFSWTGPQCGRISTGNSSGRMTVVTPAIASLRGRKRSTGPVPVPPLRIDLSPGLLGMGLCWFSGRINIQDKPPSGAPQGRAIFNCRKSPIRPAGRHWSRLKCSYIAHSSPYVGGDRPTMCRSRSLSEN